MSDYGLQIRNASGNIQIDSTYKNYTYYEHDESSLNSGVNEISITDTDSSLILVIKPPTTAYVSPYGFLDTTTTGTYESIMLATDSTCSCEWLLYRDGESTTSGDYGLIVADSTSNIIFNSNETGYTTIEKVHGWSFSNSSPESYADITVVDATNNYFQFLGNSYRADKLTDGTLNYYQLGLKKIDSTTIRIGFILIKTDSTTPSGTGATAGSASPNILIEFRSPPSI